MTAAGKVATKGLLMAIADSEACVLSSHTHAQARGSLHPNVINVDLQPSGSPRQTLAESSSRQSFASAVPTKLRSQPPGYLVMDFSAEDGAVGLPGKNVRGICKPDASLWCCLCFSCSAKHTLSRFSEIFWRLPDGQT